jgi:hypothetical protein
MWNQICALAGILLSHDPQELVSVLSNKSEGVGAQKLNYADTLFAASHTNSSLRENPEMR